jgi:hypothetical protein
MHNGSWLPLVDGTVLSGQRDPVDSNETQIMMFAPDGSEQVIWSTRDATGIDAYAGDPLFAGPLEPAALDGP